MSLIELVHCLIYELLDKALRLSFLFLQNAHIGLFENLEQETRDLYSIIHDREIGEVPVINKSAHRHFEDCYTEETKAIVSELYKDDIKLYEELLNA